MSIDDADESAREPGIDGEQGRSEPTPSLEVVERFVEASETAAHLDAYLDPDAIVIKDLYTWEHVKRRYYYEDDGSPPLGADGEVVEFDPAELLGFDPRETEGRLSQGESAASALADLVEERTVNVNPELDEDAFFSTADGETTVTDRYDLERTVPMEKKTHFRERERYWVNEPYAFVIVFRSERDNETKYYLVEPYRNAIETDLTAFLVEKLRAAIKYTDDALVENDDDRRDVIESETRRLLERYDLYERPAGGLRERLLALLGRDEPEASPAITAPVRPEPAVLEEDADTVSEAQIVRLLYYLKRDFIGYERIDGIKHDINVEDVSCDGYHSPVFVYHSEYEQIITNVTHGEKRLDDFVVKLAQRSGKGISKRNPQVDATLPDGSRAQLTLGREVSDHGTNYTIRQFKDVPFTPLDLINWHTFSLEEMAFLWLCIENHKSLIFAGGTASGKTTSLNAVSLFIPSNTKIVSIEDTREVELPQRNWIASVTRPSFSDGDGGDVDEFDLLEAALRQRPDYIVMGEIRGEEGRTLFQVMSTGHTTYTTFHADSVGEVLKRFTTEPINVSKTMFTALDLVSIQTSTRVQGAKVRRNKSLTEINHYDAEHDEINVRDVYQWQAESDAFLEVGGSNTLEEIRFDRGWSNEELDEQLFLRKVVLAYLIENGLNEYRQVAATLQAFINDPETITALIANDELAASLEALREMESVLIDVEPEKEALVPRPEPDEETSETARGILERAESEVFEEHRGPVDAGVGDALVSEPAEDVTATPAGPDEDEPWFDEGDVDRAASDGGTQVEDASRASDDERREPSGSERGGPSDDERSVESESSTARDSDEEVE